MPLKLPQLEHITQFTRQVRPFGGMPQDRLPSLAEFTSLVRSYKPFEIYHTTPQLRLKESDQVAPAGEYRWSLAADQASFERALTADYATVIKFLKFDFSASIRRMIADEALRVHWDNAGLEIWHNDGVLYTGDANSGAYFFGHLNSLSVASSVFKVSAAADPGGANFPYAEFINRPLFVQVGLAGDATQDIYITPNYNNSGTGRILIVTLRNTAGSQLTVWQAFPNGANGFVSTLAPNFTPTVTELPATFLGFVVDGTDALKAYFNKAGAIKSLSIGTLV